MAHHHAGREILHLGVLLGFIGDHGDLDHALGLELAGDLRHGQMAFDRLAAGHRHRVVEQQLVGDVDTAGGGGAHGQDAGMEVGAVADIGEHVGFLGERRLADPGRPLAAHLAVERGGAVHPLRHVVAADAGERAAAVDDFCRCVVRAAGTEIRFSGGGDVHVRQLVRPTFEKRPARGQRLGLRQAAAQRERDVVGGEFAARAQQRTSRLVVTAEHAGALGLVVEDVAHHAIHLLSGLGARHPGFARHFARDFFRNHPSSDIAAVPDFQCWNIR